MEIKKCKVICFSPTDATRKIINSIVNGLDVQQVEVLDINKYDKSRKEKIIIDSDIVIIGSPVYGGRIVREAQDIFEKIEGRGKLAIIVSVYGNVSAGVSIGQLYDICIRKGLKVIGMGTFIGEHSFSTEKVKVGYGRPNDDDIIIAKEFGKKVKKKLVKAADNTDIIVRPSLTIRCLCRVINRIYKFIPQRSGYFVTEEPVIDKYICTRCGICVKNCPMNAISNDDDLSIDKKKCIRCFRCAKKCPKGARKIEYRLNPVVSHVLKAKGCKDKNIRTKI